jgi:hypothetical protein
MTRFWAGETESVDGGLQKHGGTLEWKRDAIL